METHIKVQMMYRIALLIYKIVDLLRKLGFDYLFCDLFGTFEKGTANNTLMIEHGFIEIYDANQATYIYKKNKFYNKGD